MPRHLILIAAAATLIGLPAAAQMASTQTASVPTARIPVAGKSDAQVQADVARAARAICRQAVTGASFPQDEFRACVDATVATAVRRPAAPAQTRYARR